MYIQLKAVEYVTMALFTTKLIIRIYKNTMGHTATESSQSVVLRPTRRIRDESLPAITCTSTDISKQTGENTPKTQNTQNKQTGPRYEKTHKSPNNHN